jgi:hypothetical protein
MSDFIHSRDHLDDGDVVVVQCDHQCNVLVMDDTNFSSYRQRRPYRHHGGFYRNLPAEISVPHSGNWNVVIDLGGGRANIRYNISYLKSGAA